MVITTIGIPGRSATSSVAPLSSTVRVPKGAARAGAAEQSNRAKLSVTYAFMMFPTPDSRLLGQ